MLEVFVAGLLCVLLKLGQVTRFKIEDGMYWFFAAVFLSLANAHWTEKTLRAVHAGQEPRGVIERKTFLTAGSPGRNGDEAQVVDQPCEGC
jgi:hypothetical protein